MGRIFEALLDLTPDSVFHWSDCSMDLQMGYSARLGTS